MNFLMEVYYEHLLEKMEKELPMKEIEAQEQSREAYTESGMQVDETNTKLSDQFINQEEPVKQKSVRFSQHPKHKEIYEEVNQNPYSMLELLEEKLAELSASNQT